MTLYAPIYDAMWDTPVVASTFVALRHELPPPPASILEVGGGTGLFTEQLDKAGYQVTVIEPSVAMARRLRARLPAVRLHPCRLDEFSSDYKFDAVVAIDVEHLMDNPVAFRCRALSNVKVGGKLVLVGPSSQASVLSLCSEQRTAGVSVFECARFILLHLLMIAPVAFASGNGVPRRAPKQLLPFETTKAISDNAYLTVIPNN